MEPQAAILLLPESLFLHAEDFDIFLVVKRVHQCFHTSFYATNQQLDDEDLQQLQ